MTAEIALLSYRQSEMDFMYQLTKPPMGELLKALPQNRIVQSLPLAPLCTYRVGGNADLAVCPRSAHEAADTIAILSRHGCSYEILGQGSNVLVSDNGVREPMIITTKMNVVELDRNLLIADAGTPCTKLASAAFQAGLTGLEFFHCLPGSVGGATFMNARAFGQEVSQTIEWVDIIKPNGELVRQELTPADFSYKRSPFMDKDVFVARASFRLKTAPRDHIRATMEANETHRRKKGEMDNPSCGCVFKNPYHAGRSAGALIDSCNLKGLRLGRAWVSHKHANFVVHSGKATAAQIRQLMERVRTTVYTRTGVSMDYEVRFLGEW